MTKTVFKALLFLAIIAIGSLISYKLATSKSRPKRSSTPIGPLVVETTPAQLTNQSIRIEAIGTVAAAREVTITPEVAGRVVFQDERLIPGGRFDNGEIIVRIDPRDYDLEIERAQANVVNAQTSLIEERSRKAVAEREWTLIKSEVDVTEEGKRLALREPQLENAESSLKGARSQLSRAHLARHRTRLRAPFDSLVLEEFVDHGQVVGPGTPVAVLVDRRKAWIKVSLPLSELAWIRFDATEPPGARIVQKLSSTHQSEWHGEVIQTLGSLDPKGKMARLLVEVKDPFEIDAARPTGLLIGATVQVSIDGPTIEEVFGLPRHTVQDQDTVYVFADGKLSIREVELIWSNLSTAFVRGALQPGDLVITSRLATPVDGMALRINGADTEGTAADNQP